MVTYVRKIENCRRNEGKNKKSWTKLDEVNGMIEKTKETSNEQYEKHSTSTFKNK